MWTRHDSEAINLSNINDWMLIKLKNSKMQIVCRKLTSFQIPLARINLNILEALPAFCTV